MDDKLKYIEIAISSCSFLLFLIFFMTIRKNSENIFFSMRSSNLMQITNLSIFLSILLYSISDILFENLNENAILSYILSIYFLFQIIIFISLVLRYHRLYICCKTNSLGRDDLLQFNFFEAKTYHYEYFYVRIMAIFIVIIIISSGIYYHFSGCNNIMNSYELLSKQLNLNNYTKVKINDENKNILREENYFFWIILSFIETICFTTYALLIIKTHLSPKVNISKEIIYIAIVNYLYFSSIGISLIFKDIDYFKQYIIIFIPYLYNLLILFISLGLPFLWGRFNETVINYDLPGELTSSLYLFLTKEKHFDIFYNFLSKKSYDKIKSVFYLDMLINIFKYRMLIFTNKPREMIVEEINNIQRIYLTKGQLNLFDENLINQTRSAIQNGLENPKINLFDQITNVIYDYLEVEFQRFIKTEEFDSLRNDLMYETYVRCKLTNYGLIRN